VTNNNPYIIDNKDVSIDVSMLYNISGNDESFICTMVQTFLKTMPKTIKKLEESLNNQDWENVYKSAHFAKSSLSVIKIDEMLDWVVQAEQSAKDENSVYLLPGLVKKIIEKYSFAAVLLKEKFDQKG